MTERLIILNLPHPQGLMRELASNPEQQKNSAYARFFQEPDAASKLTAEGLAEWVKEPAAKAKYVEAFRRSSFEGMLNYYKANYPRPPYADPAQAMPKVKCPVLLFHGLRDKALLAPGAEWHLGLRGQRVDARHDSHCGSLRTARRLGPRDANNG